MGIVAMLTLGSSSPVVADNDEAAGEPRPQPSVLRLAEADVLAGFTVEVRTRPDLRERALLLWRSHFAAQADTLSQRFVHEPDWRPVLADAAKLVDDYLETSLLPRARQWAAGPDHVWVEKLDPATGQRTRALKPVPHKRVILAPQERLKKTDPAQGGLREPSPDGRRPTPNRPRD